MDDRYFTMRGYAAKDRRELSSTMEDYLEMMKRILQRGESIRVRTLSEELHVKPSSVSKMIGILDKEGFVASERYGKILLTEKGHMEGDYLLYRHAVVLDFLKTLHPQEDALEETEKIEHYLTRKTVFELEKLTGKMKCNQM